MKMDWMHGAARLLSAAALLWLPQAHAINAADAPLPAAVDDQQLAIGHRALVLPGALKSFFEHRDHQATLPPLPHKAS